MFHKKEPLIFDYNSRIYLWWAPHKLLREDDDDDDDDDDGEHWMNPETECNILEPQQKKT